VAAKKKRSKSRGTTLTQPAATIKAAGVPAGDAGNFSDQYVDTATFDRDVRSSDNWTRVGESLMRAARAVMRQAHLDATRPHAEVDNEGRGALVVNQAIFLAAFALENALKAVIAERHHQALQGVSPGKLPSELSDHDLDDLASTDRANIVPADNHEREALKRGQNYTEWLGRYATPVSHRQHHSRAAVDVLPLLAAYERLFGRCIEAAETYKQRRLGRTPDEAARMGREQRALSEWLTAGIDPLPLNRIANSIESQTYPGFAGRVTAR
jgi:hypothetical protein